MVLPLVSPVLSCGWRTLRDTKAGPFAVLVEWNATKTRSSLETLVWSTDDKCKVTPTQRFTVISVIWTASVLKSTLACSCTKINVPVVASETFSLPPARLQPSSEHSIYLQENATENICVDYQNLLRTFSWTFATFYDGMTAD
jgi:hypothetical protein